ncbi:MAG: DUF4142 domain-containing protein [bacterium]
MKNWTQWVISILMIAASTAVGYAKSGEATGKMPTDKAFLDKVSQINLAEVELGKLAEKKGGNDAVKQFGKLMVSDHSNGEKAANELAGGLKVTIPEKPGKDAVELKAQLSRMHGSQFDEDYIHHMVAGHNGAIAMIENEIENGQNPRIKGFAEEILPIIQDHLRVAENVAGKMGLSGKEGLSQPDNAIEAPASPK